MYILRASNTCPTSVFSSEKASHIVQSIRNNIYTVHKRNIKFKVIQAMVLSELFNDCLSITGVSINVWQY